MGGPEDYDVVVVGAGAGGLGAARAAVATGRRVALVEAARPGGDCTWTGCVPSKTLLETARTVHAARTSGDRGVRARVDVDFPAVMAHVWATRDDVFADESPAQLRREGIALVAGRARFVARDVVTVVGAAGGDGTPGTPGARTLRARRFVLATGAEPRIPDVVAGSDVAYLTSESVWDLTAAPEHLLVLGGGPVGCELAQAFRRLGSRVSLVQSGPRLLPRDEPAAATVLCDVLRREGVDVRLDARVERVAPGPVLHLADGTAVAGSALLVCTGRRPRTDLGLDAAGVRLDGHGRVAVDRRLRSVSAEHVYAVGDCAAALAFTHVADDQARLAVRNLLWADRGRRLRPPAPEELPGSWDDAGVPWVTFTDPEVAHVGLTEAQAHARHGSAARVARVPLAATDRARCAGRPDGFVQLVGVPGPFGAKRLLRLAGMTAVAPAGGELLGQGALAVSRRMPLFRLALLTTAYPTWSIATRVAAALFFQEVAGMSARPARPDAEPPAAAEAT